jgi:hypothetical protein
MAMTVRWDSLDQCLLKLRQGVMGSHWYWHQFLEVCAQALREFGDQVWAQSIAPVANELADAHYKPGARHMSQEFLVDELVFEQLKALCTGVRFWNTYSSDHLLVDEHALAHYLLKLQEMPTFISLYIQNIPLSLAMIEALIAHRPPQLIHLDLSRAELRDEHIALMVASPSFFDGLITLGLEGNRIRSAGAASLAECAALSTLQSLNLRENPIGDEGRLALGRSIHLSHRAKSTARAIVTAELAAPVDRAGGRELFGEVRSSLQAEPCERGWLTITDRISRMSADQIEQEISPYLHRGLDRWPAALCDLPALWTEQILRGDEPHLGARFAKSVLVPTKGLNAKRAAAMNAFFADSSIESITLDHSSRLSLVAVQALLKAPHIDRLRALDSNLLIDEIAAALEGSSCSIERLCFESLICNDLSLRDLLKREHFAQLKALHIRQHWSGAEHLSGCEDLPRWWQLEALECGSRNTTSSIWRPLLGRSDDPAWAHLATLRLTGFPAQQTTARELGYLDDRLPALRDLSLMSPDPIVWRFLPRLGQTLTSLELVNVAPYGDEKVYELAAASLPALRSLRVEPYRDVISVAHGLVEQLLCAAPSLTQLTLKGFPHNAYEANACFKLLPQTLESLMIDRASVGPEGFATLAAQPLPALTSLTVREVNLPIEAIQRLISAPWWPQLTQLTLASCRIAQPDLTLILSNLPPKLIALSLEAHDLGALYKTTFGAGSLPPMLERLNLTYCSLNTRSFASLIQAASSLGALYELDLRYNSLTPKALEPLLTHEALLNQLVKLDLSGTKLGFAGKETVMQAGAVALYTKGLL